VRLVVALGGNALLERGEVPIAEIQEKHVAAAVQALAPIAHDHDLVITHGNGPQVGLLALESARDPNLPHPYPFDVLVAQTQGMIGYLLLQAIENALPGRRVVSLICQTLVDAGDPAFGTPSKFVGPSYGDGESHRLAKELGWEVRRDGAAWRRVVASPEPQNLVEMSTIRMLLADGAIVICAGGGGIPVCRSPDGSLYGVEAVVDKDLTASMLATELQADRLLLLTDVAAVELGFGTQSASVIRRSNPTALRAEKFSAGSMAPKVDAACRFVEATGETAMIGRLEDAAELLAETTGTVIKHEVEPVIESTSRSDPSPR
jgi:carbamate kinase